MAWCLAMSPAGAVGRSVPWDAGRSAGVQSWQDYAVVRSRAAGHGKMLAKRVPRRPTVARYSRHASEKPRKRAFGDTPREDLAKKGPFPLRGPLKSCTARGSCHAPTAPNSTGASGGRDMPQPQWHPWHQRDAAAPAAPVAPAPRHSRHRRS